MARKYIRLKTNNKFVPDIPARQPLNNKMKHAPAPPTTSPTTTDSNGVSQADIEIPNDGCLFNFTADEMSSFFRHLSVNEHLVKHLHSKSVDGKRFSKFKDADLETLGIRNPVVTYFRDKSVKKVKPKMDFIL